MYIHSNYDVAAKKQLVGVLPRVGVLHHFTLMLHVFVKLGKGKRKSCSLTRNFPFLRTKFIPKKVTEISSKTVKKVTTSVPSKLCACARAHGFQRLRTRVNILRTDTQYHHEAMFSVGKLRKIALEPAIRTHFFAKCTVQWLRVVGARGGAGAPKFFIVCSFIFFF